MIVGPKQFHTDEMALSFRDLNARGVVFGRLETGSGRLGSSSGGDGGAVMEVCGHGVVAMDGVNVVKPSGYSVGKGIWE